MRSRANLPTSRRTLEPITVDQIEQASSRIRGTVLRTPVVRLNTDSDMEIYLKLENLQPTGCFKGRGGSNAIASAGPTRRARGPFPPPPSETAQAATRRG